MNQLSTGNILDVAPRYWCPTSGNEYQHPGKCPECGDTLGIVEDVADRATGNAPVTDGLQVGDEGVSSAQANPQGSSDSQYQDLLIERLIGSVERAEEHAELLEQLRLEEEAAAEPQITERQRIDAAMNVYSRRSFSVSSTFDPASDPRFA